MRLPVLAPRAAILGAAIAVAVVTGLLTVLTLAHSRSRDLQAASNLTRSFALVIAEQTSRSLQTVELQLESTAEQLHQMQVDGTLDEARARQMLRAQLAGLPYVRAIYVLSPTGRIAFDSDEGNIGESLADREYFLAHRDGRAKGLYVAAPVRSRSVGSWLLGASVAVRDAKGKLEWVVAAAVEPSFFETVWSAIELGEHGVVSLFERGGRLMMRSPPVDAFMGKDFSGLSLFTTELRRTASGVFRGLTPLDGRDRIVGYQVLPAYPGLVIAVGSAYDDVLAAWRALAWTAAALWILAVSAGLVLAFRLHRQAHHLKTQTDLLAMAGRMARMGPWIADLDRQVVTWGGQAGELLDLHEPSTPVADLVRMFTPESARLVTEGLAAAVDRCEPFDVEVELVTPRGRHIWLRSIGEPVRSATGTVTRIVGTQQDITRRRELLGQVRQLNAELEQKVAQRTEQLARQEALFRTLAHQAPIPIWMVDREGSVTFLSRAFYDLVGGEPPRWLGYEWLKVVHPEDVPAVQEGWQQASAEAGVYAGTRRLRAADGSWHVMSFRATPVLDDEGRPVFWVGVDTDITEMMARQAALTLANEHLQTFSSSVSHDLRSPVQRIRMFADLVLMELGPEPGRKARHYTERIAANADQMADLIDGLLALASVANAPMHIEPVNISYLATEVLTRLQSEEPGRSVTWRVEEDLMAMGDVRLLRSALTNLLGNAWKFTSRREDAVIEFGRTPDGEFYVKDNGAGFDNAYAAHLFGTFERLHKSDEFPGTGIGLATVSRAIQRQGGAIRGEGRPGVGATFYFTLPAVAGRWPYAGP